LGFLGIDVMKKTWKHYGKNRKNMKNNGKTMEKT
jgi:hypothetical protein